MAIAATTFLIWVARCYFQPTADCERCGGTGKNLVTRTFGGGRKNRQGPCGKCGGSGKRWVLGAKTVHKMLGRKKG